MFEGEAVSGVEVEVEVEMEMEVEVARVVEQSFPRTG